jgi:hypothetical protein
MSIVKGFISIVLFYCGISAQAQTTNHKVYSLFVYNIARYSSIPAEGNQFKITVLGKSNVLEELQKVSATKDVNGKKMIVEQQDNVAKISESQIIYVSDGRTSAIAELVRKFEGKPVLIISEREGFYKRGAGISFVVSDDTKLRVDINRSELEKRQIKVSQNIVLTIANVVI